jgi:predicted  nucleic acid-binding Zn-ribbon protein
LASLREKLKALEELQQIDLESHEVRAGLEGLPARQAAVEAKVVEARKAYDGIKAQLEGNERERRQIEALLAMERDKVKKWEGRLGEIKTPREYAALSREIDIAKKTHDSQGEQSRALTDAALALRLQLETRGEGLSDVEEAAEAGLAELARERAALEGRLASLAARRDGAVALVDPGLLAKYENIRKRRAGVAVAPVVGSTCQGCHRNIPPQLSIVLQRADSIETCPNCHRIIYSHDAVNPPAPPPPA